MFRRSTKLTALLVAAASVASVTPVMALEKLNQKDATVTEGVAYDGGKYAYYGYRTDDDDTGIYYNNGSDSKDKYLEDLDDYEIQYNTKTKYGSKYIYVAEDGNNDEYLVDLSTGKIVDDETAESKQDSAQSKFISKVKKTERYNQTSDKAHEIDSDSVRSNRLFKNQFGDVWYQYVVATTSTDADKILATVEDGKASTTGSSVNVSFGQDKAGVFTGFFNEDGKYIDASYLANLKVYSARKDKSTVIEKFGKVYKDEAVKAELKELAPIAQDKDNIYAVATVDITYYACNADGNYVFEDDADFATYPSKTVTQWFVQKISKAQGEKEDEAYVPKTVDSYQLDRKNGVYGNDGDRNKAFDLLTKNVITGDYAKELGDTVSSDVVYSVKDGNIYAAYIKGDDKVQAFKIKLGKDKLDINSDSSTTGDTVIDFTNKDGNNAIKYRAAKGEDIDTKIVKVDADGDKDYELPGDNTVLGGVSIDVDGNIWSIYHGKVYMFDNGDWKDKYSTDRSYDRLDVYDKDSLIAWSKDTDSYTTVKEGKKQTVDDAKEIDSTLTSGAEAGTAVKTGWEQQADGTWVLYDATGNKTTGWANVSGTWYYMDQAGIMKTGWVNDNGTWYYCNASGAMQTGWLNDNGTWYYLQSNGAMKTGWLNDNGTWYYLKSSGAMAANETIDGYYVNASGAWVK